MGMRPGSADDFVIDRVGNEVWADEVELAETDFGRAQGIISDHRAGLIEGAGSGNQGRWAGGEEDPRQQKKPR
jgi:hypothetical protein